MARSTGTDGEAQAARVRLGRAIERAMRDAPRVRTQEVLADLLSVDQTTVSKMINGKVGVAVDRIAQIERLCDLPAGQILFWAGLVEPDLLLTAEDGTVIQIDVKRPRIAAHRAAETAFRVAARGVDLDELQAADPEAYERIQEIGRDALARAKRRRKR